MIRTASLGFPCLGENLEQINVLNNFFNGKIDEQELYKIGYKIRKCNIEIQKKAHIDIISSNDFTWHDQVWDASVLLGNIPSRYYWEGGEVPTDIYFAPTLGHRKDKFEVPGMEYRPWFNTKLYYTVPEFQDATDFVQSDNKIMQHFIECSGFGVKSRPILLGPITYIMLGKVFDTEDEEFVDIDFQKTLNEILDVYSKIFINLKRIGVLEVQIDEPFLTTDISTSQQNLYSMAYEKISSYAQDIKITLTTGFGDIGQNADLVFSLPVKCIHLDLVSAPNQIEYLAKYNTKKEISLGLIDGQNVFINDIENSVKIAQKALEYVENIQIAPSCNLSHCPINLENETKLDQNIVKYLSFSKQKLDELTLIKRCLENDLDSQNIAKIKSKLYQDLANKISSIKPQKLSDYKRSNRGERVKKQKKDMNLKHFPFTAMGGLPIFLNERSKKNIDGFDFKNQALELIKKQNNFGFDVMSTGEYDRDSEHFDYFVNFMKGDIVNTQFGWIKTYCNKIEKPPIIFGEFDIDINEKHETKLFALAKFIKENTNKPVKYRITGPVMSLHRSFSFEGFSNKNSFLSLMSNVIKKIVHAAISKANIDIIQLDENNILEQMPQRIIDCTPMLSGLSKYIQNVYSQIPENIQTHLYIANSNIFLYIDDLDTLDADVLLLESARSGHDILKNLPGYKYQGDIGIGVYDAQSFYTPSIKDINHILKSAIRTFDIEKLWITYDYNFKIIPDNFFQSMGNINDVILGLRTKFLNID